MGGLVRIKTAPLICSLTYIYRGQVCKPNQRLGFSTGPCPHYAQGIRKRTTRATRRGVWIWVWIESFHLRCLVSVWCCVAALAVSADL